MSDRERYSRRDADTLHTELAYGEPPEPDATDEAKACYVLARWAIQNDHYSGLNRQWVKPIFFLVGKQHLGWDSKRGAYSPDTDVPSWRQQPVTNWTYAVYRTLLAKLTKQRPVTEVVPPSGDSEDREAALLGEAVLQYLWRVLKTPQKVRRAIGWLLATGNVAFDVDWDAEGGERVPRTVLVEMPHPDQMAHPGETVDVDCACDENGEPYRQEAPAGDDAAAAALMPAPDGGLPYDLDREPELDPTGEVTLDVLDPLSYRLDPLARDIDDAVEVMKGRLWPVDEVCRRFDVDEDDLLIGGGEAGGDREDLEAMLEAVTAGAPDSFDALYSSLSSARADGEKSRKVLVVEYYAKPCDDYPKGRHWVVAGGTKVWPKGEGTEGEAELPHGFWPPIITTVDCPIPGQPQGLGVLSQVVTLNEKYNYIDGKIAEYHNMMAMGGVIWVHPDDKNVRITTEPGQVRVSRGLAHGHPPVREQLTALPSAVYEERAVVRDSIQSVAATSQLDLGQKPEGVSAGRAFLVIQEATDAAIGTTLQALEEAIEEIGRRQLAVVREHYTEERTIAIRGERGQWEYRSFAGADLRDGLDVRVQAGSSFPFSKTAQLDTKLSILERNPWLVNDPQTGQPNAAKFSKFLDVAGTGLQAFGTDEDDHLLEIHREHAMFEAFDPQDTARSNELPQLAVWQDQMRHLDEHYAFMRRSYARFKRWSEPAQLAFVEHMRLTQEAVAEQIASITAPAAAGADGASPQPPGDDTMSAPPSPADAGGAPAMGGAPGRGNLRLTRGDRASAGQTA